MIEYAVSRLLAEMPPEFLSFIHPLATLVPMPRSAPFPPRQPNVLWVPRRISEALLAVQLGAGVLSCLRRATAVPKSAAAAPGMRPDAAMHLASFEVDGQVDPPQEITIVDDVITKGATLLAAASALQRAFPKATIRGFALVRTMGLVPDIERLVHPVVGEVTQTGGGGTLRVP
jgi:hypothetical protein